MPLKSVNERTNMYSIILLNIFCILKILFICCSLSYEFLKEDYIIKKLYILINYQEYIDSCFYFHNILLLQYEELIRRMQKQIIQFLKTVNAYSKEFTSCDDYKEAVLNYNDSRDKYIISEKTSKNDSKLFYLNYITDENIKKLPYSFTFRDYSHAVSFTGTIMRSTYQQYSNSIFSHDIYDFFRIPDYNIHIMKTPYIINVNSSILQCHNGSRIHQLLIEAQNDSSYIDNQNLTSYKS